MKALYAVAFMTVSVIAARCAEEVLFQDDFAGRLGTGWSWVREHPGAWRLTSGGLEVRVEPGNMWGPQNDARNVLVRPAPEAGEIGVSAQIENHPTNQYEQVDLVWYYDDSNMVKLGLELVNGKLSVVMGREERDQCRTIAIIPVQSTRLHVRLLTKGKQIRGQFRVPDAKDWCDVGECALPVPKDGTARLSLQFYQGPAQAEHWARVGEFQVSQWDSAPADSTARRGLFDHENLTAWCVVPFDAKKRGPEERAEMLQRLGFRNFAYDWRAKDVPNFGAEVEAMKRHGINLVAWWFPTEAADLTAQIILEVIKRHSIHPQLWVMGSGSPTSTDLEQKQRIDQEAERICKLVELARPYGCQVELYNHNAWFGQPDNEVAVIERLKQKGVNGVGMVYNFSHGHRDVADFPAIWKRIRPYVVAVNVTGMVIDERLLPPSQGEHELEMLRTIQESGWHGPIGLIAEQGGDAEVTLSTNLRGLDWLTKELDRPGSGGQGPRF